MKAILLASFLLISSFNLFAQVTGGSGPGNSTVSLENYPNTCSDLQIAEARILSVAYYNMPKDAKAFCYFLSRAVASPYGNKIGLDGLVQGGIEYCVDGQSKISSKIVAKEISNAIKMVKNCYSEIGQ